MGLGRCSSAQAFLTFSTPQLDRAIFCSQPPVTQKHLHLWIFRCVRLSLVHPHADLHPAAVPGQVWEFCPHLQMKPAQQQTTQSLAGLDQD